MRKQFIAGLIAAMVLTGLVSAQTKVKKVPVTSTSPVSGPEMYTTYCAVCHGKDGKGSGPASGALKMAPADLTTLAAHNGGTYPAEKVMQMVSGDDEVMAHGSRDMPVWGEMFRSIGSDRTTIRLRLLNLSDYIKTLQQK